MWMYAVSTMTNGKPDIGASPFHGYVLAAGPIGQYGLYIFSGSAAQMTTIGQLATVWPLCAMTDNGTVKWAELDTVVSVAIRAKLNNWLTARGYPNIPAGWTYRQSLLALIQRIKRQDDDWSLDEAWVKDA